MPDAPIRHRAASPVATPSDTTDIYTAVATQIGCPVELVKEAERTGEHLGWPTSAGRYCVLCSLGGEKIGRATMKAFPEFFDRTWWEWPCVGEVREKGWK